jgi:flagellar basal body rod protein FlgG
MAEISSQVISSIGSLTEQFNIIANNLANVSTAGFKRRCTNFSSVLDLANQQQAETEQAGELVTSLDFGQGNLNQTGRSLDLAINGKGFFAIETPEGPLYTRNGIFRIGPNGQLVDSQGRTAGGESGAINVPNNISESQILVLADGTVKAGQNTIGKLRVVDFGDTENKLVPAGLNCYSMPDKEITSAAAKNFVVKQGYLESSNVQIIDELVNMMMVNRLYEANMKLVSTNQSATRSLLNVAMG